MHDRSPIRAIVLFLLLLAGAGGAGFWAWREGYIDLQAMFGSSASTTAVSDAQTGAPDNTATIVAPTPDQPGTLLFSDDDGRLSRNRPDQGVFFGARMVSDSGRDVRSV